jgi:hypothetical protein
MGSVVLELDEAADGTGEDGVGAWLLALLVGGLDSDAVV